MELQNIESKIQEIRGQKVMLDFDLASLYEVGTKVLNQAVKRNLQRFPADFMFQLTEEEWKNFKSESDGLSGNRSQIVTSSQKHRVRAINPYAFTEQGIAMLSSVLRSANAIDVNIAIMRAFVFMRQYALTHKDLSEKLRALENKYEKKFKDVYEAIHFLLQKDKEENEQKQRRRIGYK